MESFQKLVDIVKTLRGPEGCPWDKAQDHQSLTPYAIEEAYELEEAIRNKDWENTQEELGDLLFQSVLHGQLADEANKFNIDDILKTLNEKMIRRHPHVFNPKSTSKETDTAEQVVEKWDQIKAKEKSSSLQEAPLNVPSNFPGLLRAQKIGKKTSKVDFDWENATQVMEKVEEELAELKEAIASKKQDHIEEELGDLLFSLAQLGRHLEIDTETSLRDANRKFLARYKSMIESHPNWNSLSRSEKEKSWTAVKASE